mmetsp:Transcript_24770/g.68509  ORF Transcript_24770/g.68509 Transcript_24770/m.68509 type:complete len:217 (-) Transcript_24770:674-1324(-)
MVSLVWCILYIISAPATVSKQARAVIFKPISSASCSFSREFAADKALRIATKPPITKSDKTPDVGSILRSKISTVRKNVSTRFVCETCPKIRCDISCPKTNANSFGVVAKSSMAEVIKKRCGKISETNALGRFVSTKTYCHGTLFRRLLFFPPSSANSISTNMFVLLTSPISRCDALNQKSTRLSALMYFSASSGRISSGSLIWTFCMALSNSSWT